MECKQQNFDWSRASQLSMLRDCVLPSDMVAGDGVKVSSGFAKSVLSQIDHFAGQERTCWASAETIAKGLNRSLRHVKRAFEVLEQASLITKERKHTNHCRIVWTELALRVPSATHKAALPTGSASEKQIEPESALATRESALATTKSALEALNPIRSAMKRKPPPTSSSLFDPPKPICALDPEWQEVEEAVAAQGVEDWNGAVTAVRKRGVVPEKVLLIVGHFARHKAEQAWGPGVLYRRLMNTTPTCVFSDHWPVVAKPKAESGKPKEAGKDRVASVQGGCLVTASKSFRGDAEDSAAFKAKVEAARQKQLGEQTELALLESELGEVLDALGYDQRNALAERALAGNPYLQQLYRKHGCAKLGMVREAMLERLKAERNTQCGERK